MFTITQTVLVLANVNNPVKNLNAFSVFRIFLLEQIPIGEISESRLKPQTDTPVHEGVVPTGGHPSRRPEHPAAASPRPPPGGPASPGPGFDLHLFNANNAQHFSVRLSADLVSVSKHFAQLRSHCF